MTKVNLTVTKYAHLLLDLGLEDVQIAKVIGCSISDLAFWKIDHEIMDRKCTLPSAKYPWCAKYRAKKNRKNERRVNHKKPRKGDPEDDMIY